MSETLLNGRYRLVAQHGSGGMAVIYKAVDQVLGRTVAVKILRPSLTADPQFIARFQNEARSIANLQHPNIVTVHDVGMDGSTHYMIMEFVEGQDLKKIIRTAGTLNIERALNYAIQICAGAGFAHRAGIVHADIKPQNILITKNDVVKLTDFGIAQALSDTQHMQPVQKEAVVWGSPHYFAPEQAKGDKPNAASDVYSIGIVIFEMLTGRLPYMGANQQELALAHIRDRVPLITEFNPTVPEQLARIVEKIMAKDPQARYRMADQLGHVLINYRDKGRENTMGTPRAPEVSSPQQPPPMVTQQRPSAVVPPPPNVTSPSNPLPMPPIAQPTQRYSPAPDAPNVDPYRRQPSIQQPQVQPQQQQYSQPYTQQPQNDDAVERARQNFYGERYEQRNPYPMQQQGQEQPQGLEASTIALAVLAFIAVAGLIPLYILVLQSWFG